MEEKVKGPCKACSSWETPSSFLPVVDGNDPVVQCEDLGHTRPQNRKPCSIFTLNVLSACDRVCVLVYRVNIFPFFRR